MITFKIIQSPDNESHELIDTEGHAYSVEIGKHTYFFVAHKSKYDTLRLSHYNSGYLVVRALDGWTGTEAQKVGRALRRIVNRTGIKKFVEVISAAPVINAGEPETFMVATIAPEPKAEAPKEGEGGDAICGCVTCKGTGKSASEFGAEHDLPCRVCNGLGAYRHANKTELDRVLFLIISQQGKTKGRIKSNWSWAKEKTLTGHDRMTFNRAYYVWRWARFHGGEDVTLPFNANFIGGSDPCRATLDRWSEIVAKRAFGSDLAGAKRWHDAFYGATS
jgi:hypothetical protein